MHNAISQLIHSRGSPKDLEILITSLSPITLSCSRESTILLTLYIYSPTASGFCNTTCVYHVEIFFNGGGAHRCCFVVSTVKRRHRRLSCPLPVLFTNLLASPLASLVDAIPLALVYLFRAIYWALFLSHGDRVLEEREAACSSLRCLKTWLKTWSCFHGNISIK